MVVRYPFLLLAELRRDVAVLCGALDQGRLSPAEKSLLRLALQFSRSDEPPSIEQLATIVAMVGSIAKKQKPEHS
jgi:hypothetical protein